MQIVSHSIQWEWKSKETHTNLYRTKKWNIITVKWLCTYMCISCVCVWARWCVCMSACDAVFKHTQCKMQILANSTYFAVRVIWSGLIFTFLAIIDANTKRLIYIFTLATFEYQKRQKVSLYTFPGEDICFTFWGGLSPSQMFVLQIHHNLRKRFDKTNTNPLNCMFFMK